MESDASESEAILALSEVLVEYGNRRTNPVLDVLPATEAFRFNQKYPAERLRFGGDQWQAYYHSHSNQYPSPWSEHGHFHLFYRVDDQGESATDWSHVVALSMSAEGQPVRWFTVNNWVCGDRWLQAPALIKQLRFSSEGDLPATRWLACMTNFYREQIVGLLFSRDQALNQAKHDRPLSDALIDRNIYYLASQAIDLKRELGIALDQQP